MGICDIHWLLQKRCNSIACALKLVHLSCTNPMISQRHGTLKSQAIKMYYSGVPLQHDQFPPQTLTIDVPQLAHEGGIWGVLCESNVWILFCNSVLNVISWQIWLQYNGTRLYNVNYLFINVNPPPPKKKIKKKFNLHFTNKTSIHY